jgi:GT2 family glycosyltransferase
MRRLKWSNWNYRRPVTHCYTLPTMHQPIVYVIVINWNGREHLAACFASLLASTYPNLRILLVDNASTDNSVTHVREEFGGDPRVEILALDQNLGWSGGNNAGIRRALVAGADYLFLLNNDTAIEPDAISRLVSAMERDERLGALAPRMVLFDQPDLLNSVGLHLSSIGASWDIGVGRMDGPRWHKPDRVIGACGGAMFLRGSILQETGLLPEDFEIYLDDLDLCLRIWNAGYTVMSCPEAVVRHKFSATMGEGSRAHHKYFLNTRNRFRIVQRHFPIFSAPYVFPQLVVGEARAMGRAVLSGEAWRVRAHTRAWLAALTYLSTAWRFRREHATSPTPVFWELVAASPQFCPRIILPDHGWYPPVVINDQRWYPLACQATLELSAGSVQVCLMNRFPALAMARISVYAREALVAELATASSTEASFQFPGGLLRIRAESRFTMEDTGAPHDAGAWLQVKREGVSLI